MSAAADKKNAYSAKRGWIVMLASIAFVLLLGLWQLWSSGGQIDNVGYGEFVAIGVIILASLSVFMVLYTRGVNFYSAGLISVFALFVMVAVGGLLEKAFG